MRATRSTLTRNPRIALGVSKHGVPYKLSYRFLRKMRIPGMTARHLTLHPGTVKLGRILRHPLRFDFDTSHATASPQVATGFPR